MPPSEALYPRHAASPLRDRLDLNPVVLITGPRQCGKTTLAQMVGEDSGYQYYSFDDHATLQAARRDPSGFIGGMGARNILDEVQRHPQILRTLKVAVDRNRVPGRFILTGSANILQMPETGDSLAGRMSILKLHPLSQSELAGTPPDFLHKLFNADFAMTGYRPGVADIGPDPTHTGRILAGGYPSALAHRMQLNRAAWCRDYVATLMQRDAVELAKIRDADALANLFLLLAQYTAQMPKVGNLGRKVEVDRRTASSYVSLLKRMYLLFSLPPWHHDAMERVARTHKLHLGDTGLACALLGLDHASLTQDTEQRGHLLETFVFQELQRQASGHAKEHRFYHYRSKAGREVDIVVQRSFNTFAGVEVKSSATIRPEHFLGLEQMRDALGSEFACGIVIYEGDQCLPWGNRLFAVPLRLLWEQEPRH